MMQISSMPGGVELDQVIVKQRARNAVGADDGKQFLLDGVRRGEVARAETGDRNDGFANRASTPGCRAASSCAASRRAER